MKTLFTMFLLCACAIPVFAKDSAYDSAESALGQASDLETRRQQLRYYEQQLHEREQTVFGKLDAVQQQYQQDMRQAEERENALRRSLQQQQEQAKDQTFRTQLQQQQEEARRREAELQRRLDEQKDRAAYERLQQGMQNSRLQEAQPAQASGQHTPPADAYGYADQQVPQMQPDQASSVSLPALPAIRPQAENHILIFDAPPPLATIAAIESKIHTTLNGIDRIETTASLPENLSVEQLSAIKQIADNGASIALQRFGLEQYQLDTGTQLSRLRVVKGFVLWGLLCSIPTLLTVYWIVRNIALGWREWTQEKLTYKLKELEQVEQHITGTERYCDAHHQR